MDDRERDKLDSSKPGDADDGEEYEIEPPDPEIAAGEHRRAQETMETTRISVNLDEIYRDAERDRGREILESWVRNFHFRFRVKHLLIATAVLAIILTLAKLGLLGVVVVVGIMLSVAGLFLYLQWQDKKQQDEADRRRQEMYARRRAHLGKTSPAAADQGTPAVSRTEMPEPSPPLPSEIDEAWQQARASREFRFRFSMQELMAAMTAAAILFGLVYILGGGSNAATLLGAIALLGLIIHALGFEPPEIVVLGWWLILVLYVVLSIVGAVWSGIT